MQHIDPAAMSTEDLQAILQEDARNLAQEPDMAFLTPIVEELTRRRLAEHPGSKTVEQALEEFNKHYRPK